jgi:hypothetical protein
MFGKLDNIAPVPEGIEVKQGWHYDGQTFTPPTPEEVAAQEEADLREARTTALLDGFDKLLDTLEANGTITQADVDLVKSITG